MVALYARYAVLWVILVDDAVQSPFWSETTVLRALEVFLREPIYVQVVNYDGHVNAQRHSFHNLRMPTGNFYKTGVMQVLENASLCGVMQACISHQVFPLMLLLQHPEDQFSGYTTAT